MTIVARFDGRCATCNGAINAGETVTWKDKKIEHPACVEARRDAAFKASEAAADNLPERMKADIMRRRGAARDDRVSGRLIGEAIRKIK